MRHTFNGIQVWTLTEGTSVKAYSSIFRTDATLIGGVDLFVNDRGLPRWKVALKESAWQDCSAQTQVQAVGCLVNKWQANEHIQLAVKDIESGDFRFPEKAQQVRGISID